MKKLFIAIACISMATALNAADYLSQTFSSGMPSTFTLIDGDGATLDSYAYLENHLGSTKGSWFVERTGEGHQRTALSPTRYAKDSEGNRPAADNRMVLPAITVNSADAVVVWEARSMHPMLLDSYRVAIREAGVEQWSDLYVCPAEDYSWQHHLVSLAPYVGRDVEIAFIADSSNGYMLGVDNIVVGVPVDRSFDVKFLSPKFFGEDDPVEIEMEITNYGKTLDWEYIELGQALGTKYRLDLSDAIRCGESFVAKFTVEADMNAMYAFNVVANDGTSVASDWVYRSYFPRTALIDRYTGTWCNNCPDMDIILDRIRAVYGNQLIVAEGHINDVLTNSNYYLNFLRDFVYSIPMIIPNHNPGLYRYNNIQESNDLSDILCEETTAFVEGSYLQNGNVITCSTTSRFAQAFDNSDGRYRVGYMLLADIYDPENLGLVQSNQASSYKNNQYYFLQTSIHPELIRYEGVIVETTYGINGAAGSLPAQLVPGTGYDHSVAFNIPVTSDYTAERYYPIAFVVDTQTGYLMNSALLTYNDPSGVENIATDSASGSNDWYNLQGIRLEGEPSAPGIYIHQGRKVARP